MRSGQKLLAGVMLSLLTTAALPAAMAQQGQAPASGLREAEDDAMIVQPFNVSVDKLEDMDLVGPGGEDIGEIDEVLVDAAGQPAAVAAEVGGFLGVGERDVVIQLDQLRLDGDRLATDLTKEQLEALPDYDD